MSLFLISAYGFAIWFGVYLLAHGAARTPAKTGLIYAGLGLLAYALGLGAGLLLRYSDPAFTEWLSRARLVFSVLPAAFWFGASLHLSPVVNESLRRLLPPAVLLIVLIALALFGAVIPPVAAALPVLLALLAALLVIAMLRKQDQETRPPRRPLVVLFTGSLFFLLSTALALLPPELLAVELVALLVGVDLALLGVGIAALDAYEQGEVLRADFLRSLTAAVLLAGAFGGQVLAAIAIIGTATFALSLLLLAVVTTAAGLPVLAPLINRALDRVILARAQQQLTERAALLAAADAVPRRDDALDLLALEDAEFARLVRRALSHLGDMGKLAASPLMNLPLIDARISTSGGTLERAAELKALLTESIARLKPRDGNGFSAGDQWRYYNALYFPYVVGLKPYSLRADYDLLDQDARAALEWFRVQVPERTLHNWQNAAAKLVAQDLREQVEKLVAVGNNSLVSQNSPTT